MISLAQRPRGLTQILLNLGKGGMEAVTVNLAQAMVHAGIPCTIIALDAGGEHEETLQRAGIPYHILGGRGIWDVRAHARLTRVLRQTESDVVHTHHFGSLVRAFPAIKLNGVSRLIHTEHSEDYLRTRSDYRRVLRALSRFTDTFVVVARAMESYYRDEVAISASRLRVISNGIDTTRFRPAENKAALRRAIGLPENATLIGTAGRLFVEKDYPSLLRASAPLLLAADDIKLVLFGDGPERSMLEALAQDLGISSKTIFTGWRTDLPQALAALDVFVLSSTREACPLVLLEAQACGVPVVSTRAGDAEHLIVDGETGILIPTRDTQALQQAIARLVRDRDLRDAWGYTARAHVKSKHDHADTVAQYADAYVG